MIRNFKCMLQKILAVFMAVLMAFSQLGAATVIGYGKDTSVTAERTSYKGEQNYLTDEQYDAFGLDTSSPSLFGADGSEEPLADFEPLVYSELLVGYGNKTSAEHGALMVMNETDTLSANAFNLDNMDNHLIGGQINQYQSDRELQTRNHFAIDINGDGLDEIIETSFYSSLIDKHGYQDIQIYYLKDGKWNSGSALTYKLVNWKSGKYTSVDYIEADNSKGYATLTAGDYDDDDKIEVAVYVPTKLSNTGHVEVVILEVNNDMSLTEKTTIDATEFTGSYEKNRFCYNYYDNSGDDEDLLPILDLTTTNIRGKDDLVINANQVLSDDIGNVNQSSSLGIYHWENNKMTAVFTDDCMIYGKTRMRFNSAVQADLNGNGVEELVVGGYKNIDWDSNKDPGELSNDENLIQVYCWNESKKQYESVWDSPKSVTAYNSSTGDYNLKLDLEQTEPAAMAAGRLHANDKRDQVFLEGIVFKFNGANDKESTEKEKLKNGYFSKEHAIELGGEHSAFISAAEIATFSTASGLAEQLVVLSGDHVQANNDNIYYDVSWTWESSGNLTTAVTNNDYIDKKDEDDGGTFVSLCALNVDRDTVKVEYNGKEYGWSAPELYCVIQSVPYWRELQYNSEGFGAGCTKFEISKGTGSGLDWDFAIGAGVFLDISAIGGVSVFGNGGMSGGGAGFSLIAQYIHTYSESIKYTDSYESAVAAGEDYAIVFAIPVVVYKYTISIPDHKLTQAEIDTYKEWQKNDPTLEDLKYKVNETIPGYDEDCCVEVSLNPSVSHMPLDEYNEVVNEYDEKGIDTGLQVITDDMLAQKTIGDPSSYPSTTDEIKYPGNVENLFISSKSASVVAGDTETTLGYEIESEEENGNGFNISLDIEAYWKAKAEVKLGIASELEWQLGGQIAADGNGTWIKSSSEGLSFSSTFKNLPLGTDDSYDFNANLAVYNMNISTGGNTVDKPYVIGYQVTGINDYDLPPGLPDDLHVLATTENEVMLRWEAVSGEREAKSYAVYGKDNLGEWKQIGITDYPYYKVTNLEPNTQYQYALVSYSEKNGAGKKSVMSSPVTAITAESGNSVPMFESQPHSVIVNPDDVNAKTFTAQAVMGSGMEENGAKLTYQWQKYNPNVQDRLGAWENIDGATQASLTLPTITEENGKYKGSDGVTYDEHTRYRLVATQTLSGDIHSVYSNSVTMFITNKKPVSIETVLELTINQDDVYTLANGEKNYVIKGENKTVKCTALLKQKDNSAVKENSNVKLVQRNSDGTETTVSVGKTDANGNVEFSLSVDELNDANQLYAEYDGMLADINETNVLYYTPAVSNSVSLECVKMFRISYDLNGGFNDVRNPNVLTNHSALITLYSPSKEGYEFKGWKLSDGTVVTELNPTELSGDNLTLYAQWEKSEDEGSTEPNEPTDPSTPNEPTNPTEPTDPTEPTKPSLPSSKEDNKIDLENNNKNHNKHNSDGLNISKKYDKNNRKFEQVDIKEVSDSKSSEITENSDFGEEITEDDKANNQSNSVDNKNSSLDVSDESAYDNKKILVCCIIGIVALAVIVFIVVWKKRKNEKQ